MAVPRRPKSTKSPPIFSHEFVIQNHADITSCVMALVIVGLMFTQTSTVASMFVMVQHNVTVEGAADYDPQVYTYGTRDLCTVFFYSLACIIAHAISQEYILDKLNRRMHLSKVKHSKFNESGQLVLFYAISAVWGIDIIMRENYLNNMSSLWEGYPHANLTFLVKFFYVIQLAYWLHSIPELYLQKVKKDEIWARVQYIVLYLVFITASYLLNFTRVALLLLVLHYLVEFIFHSSRLLYFSDKMQIAKKGFTAWNVLFVLVRLITITLAVLTFWYGLSKTSTTTISVADGNFNTQIVRVNCLAAVCLLQAWIMWHFINFHLRRMHDRVAAAAPQSPDKKKDRPLSPGSSLKKRKAAKAAGQTPEESRSDEGSGDEPTVNENGNARHRSPKHSPRNNRQ